MKNLVIVFVLILMTSFCTLQAQIGVRAGINIASQSANAIEKNYTDYKNTSIIGYQAGIIFPIQLVKNVVIQPELMWIQKGGKSEYAVNDNNKLVSTLKSNYVEIPVSLKLGIGDNTGEGTGFYVLAGPYIGLALNSEYKNELTVAGVESSTEKKVDYSNDSNPEKRMDWGANLGAGVTLGNVFIEARYNLGINNLLDNDANNTNDNAPYRRNRGIGLSFGVRF